MNHTPTPWKIESGINPTWILFDEKTSTTIGLIGDIPNSNSNDIDYEEQRGNAEFIVRACNGWNDVTKLKARIAELEDAQ